jgi:hypothetical protein
VCPCPTSMPAAGAVSPTGPPVNGCAAAQVAGSLRRGAGWSCQHLAESAARLVLAAWCPGRCSGPVPLVFAALAISMSIPWQRRNRENCARPEGVSAGHTSRVVGRRQHFCAAHAPDAPCVFPICPVNDGTFTTNTPASTPR